jgi:hypothetical protein
MESDFHGQIWTMFLWKEGVHLHHQGPEHTPLMHRSLEAYCAILLTPMF